MAATGYPTVNSASVRRGGDKSSTIAEQTEPAIGDSPEGAVTRTLAKLTALYTSGVLRENSEAASSALSHDQTPWASLASAPDRPRTCAALNTCLDTSDCHNFQTAVASTPTRLVLREIFHSCP